MKEGKAPTDAPPKIAIKGIRDGLLITVGNAGAWESARQAILDAIGRQADFFRGARVALDLGTRAISPAQLGKLHKALEELGITLWAVVSESPKTVQAARGLGLATRISQPAPPAKRRLTQPRGEEAVLVRGTLRSGMRVEFQGHVVVLGNVHPGAEVVAGGNIIVWGRLRGLAHAGAWGDRGAVVCALDLSPTQLRIADAIAAPPSDKAEPLPEIASLKDGQVVAEPWDAY